MSKKKSNNRLRPLVQDLIGTELAEDVMDDLILLLRDTQTMIPLVNKVYVFTYFAAKPDLLTDRYPIVAVTGVYEWGFSGVNLHLQEPRNYNYDRRPTPMYMLKPNEVSTALALPLMRLYQN